MRRFFKGLGIALLALVCAAAVLLAVLSAAEYRPSPVEAVDPEGAADAVLPSNGEITVLTWNTGYGALGDNADFFMDGGTGVKTADTARLNANTGGILETVRELDPDLLFLQEVDRNSDRSERVDQAALYAAALEGRQWAYAPNYRALYVPFPVPPIGRVESGIVTFSRYRIASAVRESLPCPFAWPIRMANLKRCLLVTRIPADDGKELVAVNLHLEAYDSGEGKEEQTRVLAEFLHREAEKGNYVLAGGDFNQIFSSEDVARFTAREGLWSPGEIDVDSFGSGFQFLMDERVPTCRSLDRPYAGADRDRFQYYLIDGFIASDNLEILSAETLDRGFVCTDHNPVLLRIRLLRSGGSGNP